MKFAKCISVAVLLCVLAASATAQTTGMVRKTTKAVTVATATKTETFAVLGNCGMCQTTIERAARRAGSDQASWNAEAHQLTITFDPAKTTVDAVQKAIAEAGYDNAGYKAPDAVYSKLHGCCQYDRTGAPSTAKSCEVPADVAQPGTPAATGSVETATFKVLGECSMCEKTIVRAAKDAGATEATWDMDTDIMIVKFSTGATSVEKIQKSIADKGYDTPSMKASNATYKALPACCQYDRGAKLD